MVCHFIQLDLTVKLLFPFVDAFSVLGLVVQNNFSGPLAKSSAFTIKSIQMVQNAVAV